MSIRLLRYGLPLLFLSCAACDRANVTAVTGPTTVVSDLASSTFAFEPSTLRPEILPAGQCVRQSPFGTRVILVIRGDVVILRSVRFRFADRFGFNALPRVAFIPGPAPMTAPISTFPSNPIPMPGMAPLPMTSPIPIPGSPQTLPFFLSFDCGVAPEGRLTVSIDAADRNGMVRTTELWARLGS
jgi:hypothetical protein